MLAIQEPLSVILCVLTTYGAPCLNGVETMRIETFNKMRLLRLQEDILSYFLSH